MPCTSGGASNRYVTNPDSHDNCAESTKALAKELYVNATKEKLVLLRHLKTREHAQELREQMLENYFKNHQAELKISHDEATQTYTSIQNGIEQYKVLAQDMRSAIETMDDSKDQLWREVENELKSNINMAGILMKEEFTSLRDDWMDKISVGLQELVNEVCNVKNQRLHNHV
nr:hypothetical protein L204_00830 [Cryptococcus depauperatus CBS 7855]